MVRKGAFRRDLYYRVRQISIHLPPLRERLADLEPIARTLLAELANEEGHAPPPTSPQSVAALASHSWPGNVRELRSLLLNALLAWDGVSPLHPESLLEAWATLHALVEPEARVGPA